MRPILPCSSCGSCRFGVVDEMFVELSFFVTYTSQKTLNAPFSVAVCMGCGATTFFTKTGKDHLLATCRHEVLEVASRPTTGTPYR